jgi:hypothetical protein
VAGVNYSKIFKSMRQVSKRGDVGSENNIKKVRREFYTIPCPGTLNSMYLPLLIIVPAGALTD